MASSNIAGELPKTVKMEQELPKEEPKKASSAENLAQLTDQEMADVEAEKSKPEKEPSPGLEPLLTILILVSTFSWIMIWWFKNYIWVSYVVTL